MQLAKLLKFGKKGAKMAPKRGAKKADTGFSWPPGLRIGVYGHSNSGKSTYFTVLNEDCKRISSDLQISVTDNVTAGEFLANYRKIWGFGTHEGPGTRVDLKEERSFPDRTSADKVLQFTVIVDRDKKLPVVTYDYPGDAVSISKSNEYSDKVADFMLQCDGILFFFDPKTLSAELECQAHVASFVNMLEQLAPLSKRLPIPVALVVTKSDTLPGFKGEVQVKLIGAEDEPTISEDYDFFVQRVLSSDKVARNPEWSQSVRDLLVKLSEFIKVAVGRTLDFQIFFSSNTGEKPEKIGAEVGRSIYKPPEKLNPLGVREPFYWMLNAIIRNRRLGTMRKITKYVAVLSLIWILLFSGLYALHFSLQLKWATSVEDKFLDQHNDNPALTTESERKEIKRAYESYRNRWLPRMMFQEYRAKAIELVNLYQDLPVNTSQFGELESTLNSFAGIVSTPSRWPVFQPGDTELVETGQFATLANRLRSFATGDSTSVLYQRAKRALEYWKLFKQCVKNKDDRSKWNVLAEQVKYDETSYGLDFSPQENALVNSLKEAIAGSQKTQVETADPGLIVSEFEAMAQEINGNPDPTFRLDDAVSRLRRFKSRLNSSEYRDYVAAIDNYISDAKWFDRERTYTYKLVTCPPDVHLHVDVAPSGQEPSWSVEEQIWPGDNHTLTWKPGADIYIAYHEPHLSGDESWGKSAIETRVLDNKYSLFDMDGEVRFLNTGKTVTFGFADPIRDKLPKLEK